MPPYTKEQGEEAGRPGVARQGAVLLLVGVGEGRKKEGEGKGGGAPPFLVQFGPRGEGARGLPWPPLLFSTKPPGGGVR